MTQIAVSSGSSASFTLPAGNRVLIAGQGTYRIGPRGTSARPTVDELIDNNSSIGPYEADCTVQIWATGASTYELIAPGDVLDQTGRPIEGAALRSLVSGAGRALEASIDQSPSMAVVSDSILAQSFRPPINSFGATTGAGSYYNGSTKTTGVTNTYAENPCRLKFRAAHNLVTGDEIYLDEMPSAHPLAQRRYIVTVTATDEVTLDGIDGTGLALLTSGSAASDAMAYVDMAYGNAGPLAWALDDLGYPFDIIDGCMRPGATSAQLAAQAPTVLTERRTLGILNVGRNDPAYDEASQIILRDLMLDKCDWVLVVLPFPDATSGGYTAGSLAKLKSLGEFWFAQQAANPRLGVCDLFGVVSDPEAALEAALSYMLGPDAVHPRGTGAPFMGAKIASAIRSLSGLRRVLSRVSGGSANLLAGGRFTGTGGTITSGATGALAAGFTFVGSSGNVTGGWVQLAKTPALVRRNSVAYVAGDILDVGDDWWYLVKEGAAGTTAATFPAAAYDGFLTGSATYDPASLADGAGVTTTVTVTGAALGDFAAVSSFSLDLQGITFTAWVSAANTVSVRFQNESGGVLDLASGTISVQVKRAASLLFERAVGITDGTATLIRIPKFLDTESPDYMDRVIWQYQDIRITADGGSEAGVFSQSVSLPAGVVAGDYIKGSAVIAQLGGFAKGVTVQVTQTTSGAAQIARAHGLAVNGLLSLAPARKIKPRTRSTPKIRVRSTTANLALRTVAYVGIEGAQLMVSLPMLEETTAPGLVG